MKLPKSGYSRTYQSAFSFLFAIFVIRFLIGSCFKPMDKKNISMDEFHELYKLKQNYVSVANSYVQGWELAEDIVADSYMFLWENMGNLEIENPKSYLLGVVKHKCLDALRHRETKNKAQEHMYENIRTENLRMLADQDTNHQLFCKDVMKIFTEQMAKMPKLTSSVFAESRLYGKTHGEISSKFGIPVRSVTYEISKAIRILKKSLGEYLAVILLLCMFKNQSHLS